MTLDEYQTEAAVTDLLGDGKTAPIGDPAHVAKILGLVGEAGEVAEKYKKIIRDKGGVATPEEKQELIKELGDVLWYVAMLSRYLGYPLEDVAKANIAKLRDRQKRGTQHGSGDNR